MRSQFYFASDLGLRFAPSPFGAALKERSSTRTSWWPHQMGGAIVVVVMHYKIGSGSSGKRSLRSASLTPRTARRTRRTR